MLCRYVIHVIYMHIYYIYINIFVMKYRHNIMIFSKIYKFSDKGTHFVILQTDFLLGLLNSFFYSNKFSDILFFFLSWYLTYFFFQGQHNFFFYFFLLLKDLYNTLAIFFVIFVGLIIIF